jgi:hypothetical protein
MKELQEALKTATAYDFFGGGEAEADDTEVECPPVEPKPRKPEQPRLDYDHKRIWLDGQWYRIKHGEAELFKDLFDAKGGRVRVQELIPHAAQIRHRMREPLKSLIKSEPGQGYSIPRLLPE